MQQLDGCAPYGIAAFHLADLQLESFGGDRFQNRRQAASYCGLCASEISSVEHHVVVEPRGSEALDCGLSLCRRIAVAGGFTRLHFTGGWTILILRLLRP